MKDDRAWRDFEEEAASILGLRLCISSGNKFFDQGDAVTPGRGSPFPLYVDCKHTHKASTTIRVKDLNQWQEQAAIAGKRFLLALRFGESVGESDYVVLSMHDFAELMNMKGAE